MISLGEKEVSWFPTKISDLEYLGDYDDDDDDYDNNGDYDDVDDNGHCDYDNDNGDGDVISLT